MASGKLDPNCFSGRKLRVIINRCFCNLNTVTGFTKANNQLFVCFAFINKLKCGVVIKMFVDGIKINLG